jgi:TolB-like protein/DNA-binding winged helix-turn-helix (wHTH) protein/Tfp pilus assembly protein PilF
MSQGDANKNFRIGPWLVQPDLNRLSDGDQVVTLEPRVMGVLVYLASRPGKIFSADKLLDTIWHGRAHADNTIYQAVAHLRKALDDDVHDPRFIETIAKKGYRLICPVMPAAADGDVPKSAIPSPSGWQPGRRSLAIFTGRTFSFAGIGLLTVVMLYLVLDNYVLEKAPSETAEELTQDSIPAPVEVDKSIAVLPFRNRSALAEDAYFVDGIQDDILTHLARLSFLQKVISRTSMEQYRETTKSMRQIGQELGVATILEGGVQRAGGRVRINVQLIDATTDEHLWVETYDRQLTVENIFAIQSEIATAIVDALQATLSAEERERLAAVPTENMKALEYYFLGKDRTEKRTTSALAEAIDYFQAAIDLDPNFALAYAHLAYAIHRRRATVGLSWDEESPKVKALALKALELDDRLGEAYAILGLLDTGWNNPESEAAFQRGIELNPNSVMAYHSYCARLNILGRHAEALSMCERALELDPLSPVVNRLRGHVLANVGRLRDAESQFRRVIEIDPGFPGGYAAMGGMYRYSYAQLGEAVRWYRQAIELDPGSPRRLASLGRMYLDLGDPEQAEYWVTRAINLDPANIHSNFGMSALNLYRGDDAAATEFARKSFKGGSQLALILIRDHELRAGRYADARALYEENYPELLHGEKPEINAWNIGPAINLALVLSRIDEQKRANLLLNLALQYIGTETGLAGAQIYALQGEKTKALASLRQAIEMDRWVWEAWGAWWYYAEHSPNLDSIRNEPEFQSMMAEIRADMAEQLAQLQEWVANGEFAPILKSLN